MKAKPHSDEQLPRGKFWLVCHARAAIQALGALARQKWASLLTVMVIAVALALPLLFYALLRQFEDIGSDFDLEGKISLYLKMDLPEERGRALGEQLGQRDDIASSHYLSREDSYQFFAKHSSFASALKELGENPLPAVIEVTPAVPISQIRPQNQNSIDLIPPQDSADLARELSQLPEVEKVRVDMEWVQRLAAISRTLQKALWVLGLLLALAVVLAVGNTIRLDVQNSARAIHVQKLIGATHHFIRRPFLYTGGWYGFFGGACAWLVVNLALGVLRPNVAAVAKLYASDYQLAFLPISTAFGVILLGICMGWLGAWLALRRHLDYQYNTF